MQRVVIMTGPDGTGKTEIGKGLAQALDIPYFKMTTEAENWREGRLKDALLFDQTYISRFLEQTGHSCIIDRAYESEWVYSQVYGRETYPDVLAEVDARFAAMGAVHVVCVRRDYSSSRSDELVEKNRLPELHDEYMRFVRWTRCRAVVIYVDDYGNDLTRELADLMPHLTRMFEEGREG